MKYSVSTILTGVLAAGALGAVGYNSLTGNCVFGSCSTQTGTSIIAPAEAQLVGLTDAGLQSELAVPAQCPASLTAYPVVADATPAQCDGAKNPHPAVTGACEAHPLTEVIALSSPLAVDEKVCSGDGTGACCLGDAAQAALDKPADEG